MTTATIDIDHNSVTFTATIFDGQLVLTCSDWEASEVDRLPHSEGYPAEALTAFLRSQGYTVDFEELDSTGLVEGEEAFPLPAKTEQLTREMIFALYGEAGNAGDTETVVACELALSGDMNARSEVARVINDARAAVDAAVRVVP